MTFDKLDKGKEQAIVSAIEQIIDTSKHQPDKGLDKIASDVLSSIDGMTPSLAHRACEAYNKSKSVYTLQKRASEDRAEDFELIDPQEVTKLMYGYHQKVAGADLLFPARTPQQNIPELRRNLEKVALDASESPESPGSEGVIQRELRREAIRLERSLAKLEENVGMAKQASEDAIHRACQVMRKMQPRALQKVAHLTVNKYGDDGVRLMKLIGAYIEKDLPLDKTANAAIFPLCEPFTSIAIAVDEARAHAKAGLVLKKADALLPKMAAAPVMEGALALSEQAGKVGDFIKSNPVSKLSRLPIYSQIMKETKKVDDETLTAALRNRLTEVRATQAFTDVASDDFIKDYPIEETMEAYNNVVGSMPELLDAKYTPWLKALVREQLVQGNVFDPASIKQLQEIGKEIKKGRIADIDEAAKQLEAGEGGILPGLDAGAISAIEGERKEKKGKESKDDDPTKRQAQQLREREFAARLAETDRRQRQETTRALIDAARDRQRQEETAAAQALRERDTALREADFFQQYGYIP